MESNDKHINDCIKAVCKDGDDLIKFKPDLEAAGVYEKCEKFVTAFQEMLCDKLLQQP